MKIKEIFFETIFPIAFPISLGILLCFFILPWERKNETEDFMKGSKAYLEHTWKQQYTIDYTNSNMSNLIFYSDGQKYTVERSKNGQEFQIILR